MGQRGYVYIIRMKVFEDKWACPYKIGKSKHVPRRVSELGIVLPYPIEIVHIIQTDYMNEVEHQMHSMFEEFHAQGEWFHLSREAVEWVCERWSTDRFAELIDVMSRLKIQAEL